MNKVESFIEKWNVGYEDLEQKEEFAKEMRGEIAQIKEDVSCKFQDWANNEEFWYEPYNNENDIKGWASTKLNLYGLTTSELYQEFIKTL